MAKPTLSGQLDQLVDALIARLDSQPAAPDPKVVALAEVARDLCTLPSPEFKARLKADLERRALMSGTSAGTARQAGKVKPIPEGYRTVTPYLCVKGAAEAIEFYKQALGATEVMRLGMPDGKVGHAEIQVGDSRVMLADEFPDYGSVSPATLGGTPVNVHLYVADPDAVAARAAAAGAKLTDPVEDRDYGERLGGFTDPFGHVWTVSRPIGRATANLAPGQVREGFHTVTPHLTVPDGLKAIEFYKQAFGAVQGETITDPDGRLAHGEIRVGDSPLMLQEVSPEYGKRSPESLGGSPVSILLYVEDVDAFAARAVRAGAKIIRPVENQFYGDRSGKLADPYGHLWFVSTHVEDVTNEEIERRAKAFTSQAATSEPKAGSASASQPRKKFREGFTTVTPYLTVRNPGELVDFVRQVFGATELFRSPGSRGGIHAEVRLGNSMLMIGGSPGLAAEKPGALHTYVDDVDRIYQRALEAGATSIRGPEDHPYGERGASVKDAFGNNWYIAKPLEGKPIPEGLRNVTPYLHPRDAAELIAFLERAFGAKELARYAAPDGRIMHAAVRIGDAVVEMGEAQGPYQPLPSVFYLYVDDVDQMYHTAVAAGGKPGQAPADQAYGDRSASVSDPFGHTWYIATPL